MPYYIPQEILDKIIAYATADAYADEPDLGRKFSSCASFVSHNFHQIILPYKFRSLTFLLHNSGYNRKETFIRTAIPPNQIPKFSQAINAGDAHALSLAPLVQELSLYGNYLLPESLEIIVNGITSFRNLTYLRMEQCVTSSTIMEQLGKLVQLQSLHTWHCQHEEYHYSADKGSYEALSNLQSLHTLECQADWQNFRRHLACIPMKNLRILRCSDSEVIKSLLTSDPPVQLKELYLIHYDDYSLIWNFIARVSSLTHLSLPNLQLPDGPLSLIFSFQELQYLHIHIAFAPRFANQPLKKMKIDTDSEPGQLMVEVRQFWQGITFPHVEHLETDRLYDELDRIPIEFWREFLLNVNEVAPRYVFLDSLPSESISVFVLFSALDNRSTRSSTSGCRRFSGLSVC